MSVLERLAPWTTTGIGSLPFDDPAAAARHAVAAYTLPFCPQLPGLEGDMVAQWLGADPGRCGWSAQRDRERPVAWDAFLAALRDAPPARGLVKLQVTGPVTLAAALEHAAGAAPSPPVRWAAVPASGERDRASGAGRRVPAVGAGLAGELATWLAANLAGQVRALRRLGLDAVLVVDEPALGGARPGVEAAWEPLRGVAAAWGLHLCCAVPWDVVDAAQPDVVSFDLAVNAVDAVAAAALRRHVARGGHVAWGVLSAHRPAGARHGYLRLTAALGRVAVAPSQSLLTAGCGTGRLSVRREQEVAAALREVAGSRASPAAATA